MYDPERQRAYALMAKYRLTLLDYEEMLADQDGRCGICKTVDPGGRGTFHIDHDHHCCPSEKTCGHCIRGLLCYACNTLLARANDDATLLQSAIRYLKRGNREAQSVHADSDLVCGPHGRALPVLA